MANTATMAECLDMFQNGWIVSSNYGNLITAENERQTIEDPGGGYTTESWVYRGTSIIDFPLPHTQDLSIQFENGKYIDAHIEFPMQSGIWDGAYNCSWTAHDEEGNVYEYREGEYATYLAGSASGNFNQSQEIRAAFLAEGARLEFTIFHEYVSDSGSTYAFGMHIIPNAYTQGTHYPTAGIEPWDLHTIGGVFMPFSYVDIDTSDLSTHALWDYFNTLITFDIEYDEGDDIPTGGGGGSYYDQNDSMSYPDLPSIGALDTGMVKLYSPTVAQMQSISSWLWSNNFFDNIIKNFTDPLNNIIGLYVSPIRPAVVSDTFKIGNLDSEIAVDRIGVNYGIKNCGTLKVKKYYNSFADYDNYRSFKIFLPYYGIVDISTDDFIGGTLNVEYHIDYFSGSATIMIKSQRESIPHILHQYSTNIYANIPFSGTNMMSYYQQMAGASVGVASSVVSGNIMGMTSGVTGLLSAHPNYGGSKSIGATGGLLGIQYPYLIECRSIRNMPSNYNKYNGIPLNKYQLVKQMTGYTQYESIRISAPQASDAELDEIEKIFKEGVIL